MILLKGSSIASLKQQLLDPRLEVNKALIKFSNCDDAYGKFTTELSNRINSVLPIMRNKLRVLNCPIDCQILLRQYDALKEQDKETMRLILSGDGDLAMITQKFQDSDKNQINSIDSEIRNLEARHDELKSLNDQIENAPEEIAGGKAHRWRKECAWYHLWRNYSCQISTAGAPVEAIEETLIGRTRVVSRTKEGDDFFDAKYTSRLKFKDVMNSLWNFVTKIFTKEGISKEQIIKGTIQEIGDLMDNLGDSDCAGQVKVFILPRKVPANIDLMNQRKREMDSLQQQLQQKQQELDQLKSKAQQQAKDVIKRNLEERISLYEENQRLIEEMVIPFQVQSIAQYENMEDDITTYANMITRLYGDRIGELIQRSFVSFMELFTSLNEDFAPGRKKVVELSGVDDTLNITRMIIGEVRSGMADKSEQPLMPLRKFAADLEKHREMMVMVDSKEQESAKPAKVVPQNKPAQEASQNKPAKASFFDKLNFFQNRK